MIAAAKLETEKEAAFNEKLVAAEAALKEAEREKGRCADEYSKAMAALEMQHQKQMNAALEALDVMLSSKEKKKKHK